MTSLPVTYRVQDGCHNCRWCRIEDYQDFKERFCVADGVPPPQTPAGRSVDWKPEVEDFYWSERIAWERGREVEPAGICDQHERKADE